MSSHSSLAGLKCLQWLFRSIELGCSVVVLGVHSYYLATLIKNSMEVPTSLKVVEGISGVATVYTALGILLVCSCAGHPAPSFISMIFDIAFAGGFIYVAVANRAGAGSCTSGTVATVYGSGDADATPGDGLPSFQMACQMQMACLIVSCVASPLFLCSVFLEIWINRSRYRLSRPIRDADGEYISKSGHYGMPPQRGQGGGPRAFLGLGATGRHRGVGGGHASQHIANPDQLPEHQQLRDIEAHQVEVPTWGDVSSLHDSDRLYFNDGESRDDHGPPPAPVRMTSTTAPRPAASLYNEGVVPEIEERAHPESQYGATGTESHLLENDASYKAMANHREDKAARLERLGA